jgi:hypothetical protein
MAIKGRSLLSFSRRPIDGNPMILHVLLMVLAPIGLFAPLHFRSKLRVIQSMKGSAEQEAGEIRRIRFLFAAYFLTLIAATLFTATEMSRGRGPWDDFARNMLHGKGLEAAINSLADFTQMVAYFFATPLMVISRFFTGEALSIGSVIAAGLIIIPVSCFALGFALRKIGRSLRDRKKTQAWNEAVKVAEAKLPAFDEIDPDVLRFSRSVFDERNTELRAQLSADAYEERFREYAVNAERITLNLREQRKRGVGILAKDADRKAAESNSPVLRLASALERMGDALLRPISALIGGAREGWHRSRYDRPEMLRTTAGFLISLILMISGAATLVLVAIPAIAMLGYFMMVLVLFGGAALLYGLLAGYGRRY